MFPPLYLITDSSLTGIKETAAIIDGIFSSLPRNTLFVQMREKEMSGREQFDFALILRVVTRRHGALFFVNDRIDIALAVKADGIHLGQSSVTPSDARRIFGGFIGYSTHTNDEVKKANVEKADFLTFGPVFETPSKAGKSVGVSSLKEAVRLAEMPVFAIGGINLSNVEKLSGTGIKGIACISAFLKSSSPIEDAMEMLKRIYSL